MFCSRQRGKSMKKRQQGDDENKKEEMVMTTLKRRATNDSIKQYKIKFRSLGALINQDNSKSNIDTWRCREKATKNYKGW
jgi:hypothetical protein